MFDLNMFWLALGCICVLLEFVVPGGLVGTLGVCALMIHALIYAHVITGWKEAFLYWMIASTAGLFVIAYFFSKFIPGESKSQNTDIAAEVEGAIVQVTESVSPEREGRIQFRDTTWKAFSDITIEKGEKAIIVAQDGNLFKIKPL